MDDLQSLLENSLERWAIALLVGIGVWFALQYLRRFLIFSLNESAEKNSMSAFVRDILVKTRAVFIFVLAIYGGFAVLDVSPNIIFVFNKTLVVIAIFQLGIWAHRLLTYAVEQREIRDHVDTVLAKGAMSTVNTILRVILWSLIGLLILGNLGFKIEPLVAGLGIGGIAIALGVQQTLQDMAASLSILFDKPFMVGDFIVIGDFLGTVERIGIKTTRVLSLTGEQIIFSNNDLLNSRVRNYKKMVERRILFTFRIPYDTPYPKVQALPAAIKKIIIDQKNARFDRAHLKQFSEYAFEYEVVYYVLSAEYLVYMDVQQQINFDIMKYFQEEGIVFACPMQIVVLNSSEKA